MSCAYVFPRSARVFQAQTARAITYRRHSTLVSTPSISASEETSPSQSSSQEDEILPTHNGATTIPDTSTTSRPSQISNQQQQQNQNHHDLPSFLAYANRVDLPSTSTVYVGTHYEYTVLQSLSRFGMNLSRIGGRSDHGVDLVGHWTLPVRLSTTTHPPCLSSPSQLKMLVQCKSLHRRPGPYLVRELEGAFNGAPVGYRGMSGTVLGLLAAPKEATAGVREAMGRSRLPLLFAMIGNTDGRVMQLLWNQRAREVGLDGLGVTVRYCSTTKEDGAESEEEKEGQVTREVALTWKGDVLPDIPTAS